MDRATPLSFMQRIQDYDGIGWLTRRFLNPFTWLALQSEGQTRIDVLQEMIEDLLQTKATMAALNQPGKQLTLLNATDMVAGQVFTFDRATLDDVCMDYDKYPSVSASPPRRPFLSPSRPCFCTMTPIWQPKCPGQRNPACPTSPRCRVQVAPTRISRATARRDIASRCATRSWSSRARATRFRP